MLNFTVGPVQFFDSIKKVAQEDIPYFRTEEFSEIIKECEKYMNNYLSADKDSKTIFLTGSGTAAMEASVINTLSKNDYALIVNGGSFGERFCEICKLHNIRYDNLQLEYGKNITKDDLNLYKDRGYTAFLINIHETSTGVLYDAKLISDFCKENDCFLIIDAISSFLADEFDMKKIGADVVITSSQKALACPPGVSMISLSQRAINRINNLSIRSYYFDLKKALKDGERGQTPFTPAVGIILQLHKRFKEIQNNGGVKEEVRRTKEIAADFRNRIDDLPLAFFSNNMSNAVSSLRTNKDNAYDIFLKLKNDYGIWVCPNGGILKNTVFRVGHLGRLSKEDNKILVDALIDLREKGFLS